MRCWLLPQQNLALHCPTPRSPLPLSADKYLPKLEQATQPQELRELTGHWADAKRNARLEQLSGPLNKAAWSR